VNILFASYHANETRTLLHPLAKRLHEQGHDTGLLYSVDGVPRPDTVIQHRFTYPHDPAVLPDATLPEIQQLITAGCAPYELPVMQRLSRVLHKLHPNLFGAFVISAPNMVQMIQRTWAALLDQWRPDVVVLSPGQIESVVIRQLCIEAGIPYIFLLTQFSEFKAKERMQLPVCCCNDDFIVHSHVGATMLTTQQNILQRRITVAGIPDESDETETEVPLPRSVILYTSQEEPENPQLDKLLFRFLQWDPTYQLILRPHPVVPQPAIQRWQATLKDSAISSRVTISLPGTPLCDDLNQASVVVGLSSIAMYEATLVNVPVVVWAPAMLPSDLRTLWLKGVITTRDADQLFAALKASVRKSRTITAIDNNDAFVSRAVGRILQQVAGN